MDYNRIADYVKTLLGIDTPPVTIAAGAVALVNGKPGALGTAIGAYVNPSGVVVLPQGITIPAGGSLTNNGDSIPQTQILAADGAITIKSGLVLITKTGTPAAITLAAPTTGTDDGKKLTIESLTAQAHTVTQTSPGFNNGSTASDVATFGAAIANSFEIVAYLGVWYTIGTAKGVTLG